MRRFLSSASVVGAWALVVLLLGQPLPSAAANRSLAPARAKPASCSAVEMPPINWDFEQRVVELVNDHRASIGQPPLKRVAPLDAAARYHACDMRDDSYFDHDSFDRHGDALVFACDTWQRIRNFYTRYRAMGENIAAGQESPEEVMGDWLSSDGHRRNIESPLFTEIGVGYCAPGGEYTHYWVQNFGRRTNEHPLIIQRDYARTDTPNVSIYIYGKWRRMRLRNDNGPWGAWQPFSNSFNWTLNWVQGTREVCAQLQGSRGTVTTCDTIELITSGS
jgi:uncharacterized protein YkwD